MGDLWAFQGRKKKEIYICCRISFGGAGKIVESLVINSMFFSSGIVPPVGGRRSGCLCLSLTVRPKKSNQAGGRSLSENVSYCHE